MLQRQGTAAVLVALLLTTVAAGKDYEIRLLRPATVGQNYRVQVVFTRQQKETATLDGEAVKPEIASIITTMIASVEVLKVNTKGQAIAEEYTIEKCSQVRDGKTTELLQPGHVLVVAAGEIGPDIRSEGQPLTEAGHSILSELFDMRETEITEDEIFGTRKRKNVGDSWDINTEAAKKFAEGVGIKMDGVKGAAKFVGLKKYGEADCLEVTAEFSASKLAVPAPDGFVVEKGTMKSNVWGLYPEAPNSPRQHEKVTTDFEMVVSGSKDGKKITATTYGRTIREVKRLGPKPVEAAANN